MIRPAPTIVLRHAGGATRTVPVLGETRNSLYVQWPLCGSYRLDLSRNVVYGTRGQWSAADIDAAWAVYRALTAPKTEVA